MHFSLPLPASYQRSAAAEHPPSSSPCPGTGSVWLVCFAGAPCVHRPLPGVTSCLLCLCSPLAEHHHHPSRGVRPSILSDSFSSANTAVLRNRNRRADRDGQARESGWQAGSQAGKRRTTTTSSALARRTENNVSVRRSLCLVVRMCVPLVQDKTRRDKTGPDREQSLWGAAAAAAGSSECSAPL